MNKPTAALAALFALSLPVSAGSPDVVTDIAPVHSLVSKILGDRGTVELLVTGQENPHHFQLRPSQIRSLAGADLIVWIGEEMTPWLNQTLEANAADIPQLKLLHLDETDAHEDQAEMHDHEHEDEHAQEGDHDDHTDTHSGGHHHGTDPHVWLNPDTAAQWLEPIAKALSDLDPEFADAYHANADRTYAELMALSHQIQDQLTDIETIPAITLHDAYGHFEDRFGVAIAGHLKDSDASTPSAARMAELQALNQSGAIKCVFTEPSHDPGAMQELADQRGLDIRVVDPVGASLEPGAELYVTLLDNLAASFLACTDQ